jgi:hypothetical protein
MSSNCVCSTQPSVNLVSAEGFVTVERKTEVVPLLMARMSFVNHDAKVLICNLYI